jgi:hypothetical protein
VVSPDKTLTAGFGSKSLATTNEPEAVVATVSEIAGTFCNSFILLILSGMDAAMILMIYLNSEMF